MKKCQRALTSATGNVKTLDVTSVHSMTSEQLKAFLEAVKTDASLQEQLKAAVDTDTVVAIAKEAGFLISIEELKKAQAEVSEQELEGVSGGKGSYFDWGHGGWQCG